MALKGNLIHPSGKGRIARISFTLAMSLLVLFSLDKTCYADCSALLDLLGKKKQVEAEAIIREKQVKPYCSIYLVETYYKEGKIDKAKKWIAIAKKFSRQNDPSYKLIIFYRLLLSEGIYPKEKSDYLFLKQTDPKLLEKLEKTKEYNKLYKNGNFDGDYHEILESLRTLKNDYGVDIRGRSEGFEAFGKFRSFYDNAEREKYPAKRIEYYKKAAEYLKNAKSNKWLKDKIDDTYQLKKKIEKWQLIADFVKSFDKGRIPKLEDVKSWEKNAEKYELQADYRALLKLTKDFYNLGDCRNYELSRDDKRIVFIKSVDKEKPSLVTLSVAIILQNLKDKVAKTIRDDTDKYLDTAKKNILEKPDGFSNDKIFWKRNRLISDVYEKYSDKTKLRWVMNRAYDLHVVQNFSEKLSQIAESAGKLEKNKKIIEAWDLQDYADLAIRLGKMKELLDEYSYRDDKIGVWPMIINRFESNSDLVSLPLRDYMKKRIHDLAQDLWGKYINSYHKSVMKQTKSLLISHPTKHVKNFLSERIEAGIYSQIKPAINYPGHPAYQYAKKKMQLFDGIINGAKFNDIEEYLDEHLKNSIEDYDGFYFINERRLIETILAGRTLPEIPRQADVIPAKADQEKKRRPKPVTTKCKKTIKFYHDRLTNHHEYKNVYNNLSERVKIYNCDSEDLDNLFAYLFEEWGDYLYNNQDKTQYFEVIEGWRGSGRFGSDQRREVVEKWGKSGESGSDEKRHGRLASKIYDAAKDKFKDIQKVRDTFDWTRPYFTLNVITNYTTDVKEFKLDVSKEAVEVAKKRLHEQKSIVRERKTTDHITILEDKLRKEYYYFDLAMKAWKGEPIDNKGKKWLGEYFLIKAIEMMRENNTAYKYNNSRGRVRKTFNSFIKFASDGQKPSILWTNKVSKAKFIYFYFFAKWQLALQKTTIARFAKFNLETVYNKYTLSPTMNQLLKEWLRFLENKKVEPIEREQLTADTTTGYRKYETSDHITELENRLRDEYHYFDLAMEVWDTGRKATSKEKGAEKHLIEAIRNMRTISQEFTFQVHKSDIEKNFGQFVQKASGGEEPSLAKTGYSEPNEASKAYFISHYFTAKWQLKYGELEKAENNLEYVYIKYNLMATMNLLLREWIRFFKTLKVKSNEVF